MQKSPYTFFVIIPHTKIPPFRRSLLVLRFFFYYKNSGFLCQEINFYYFQGKNMIFLKKLLDKPKNETIMQSVQKKKGIRKKQWAGQHFSGEPLQRTIGWCEMAGIPKNNPLWAVQTKPEMESSPDRPLTVSREEIHRKVYHRGSCLSDRPKETADN